LGLLNDLLGLGNVKALVIEPEGVLALSDAGPLAVLELAVGLVVPEPLADLIDLAGKVDADGLSLK
jgi:hypothetical protein